MGTNCAACIEGGAGANLKPVSEEEKMQLQELAQSKGLHLIKRKNQIYTDMNHAGKQKREMYMLSSSNKHTKVNHVSDSESSYSQVGSDDGYPEDTYDKGKPN